MASRERIMAFKFQAAKVTTGVPTSDFPVNPRDLWTDFFPVLAKLRFWILLAVHAFIFAITCLFAYALRFEFQFDANAVHLIKLTLAPLIIVKLVAFYLARSFHGWWRYVTFADLRALGIATTASLLGIVLIDYFFLPYQIPRSVVIIDAMLTILIVGLVRSSWRLLQEEVKPRVKGRKCRRSLMIGTSDTAIRLAAQIRSHPHLEYNLVGTVSVNTSERRQWLSSLPLLGDISRISDIIVAHRILEVLIPAGEVSGAQMRQLSELAASGDTTLHVIPRVEDYFRGNGRIPVRDVDINDLLRREPIVLDNTAIGELVTERRILVTGAGGSIGSEICRQILNYNPLELLLLGRGENRIFAIEQELIAQDYPTKITPLIGDITDKSRMRQVFETYRPEIVFHAAAHKHVPLMEINVGEAVKNNIVGTRCIADLADEYAVKSLVLISTDKAVNPTSVMGTTKHLAERYVNAMSAKSSTRFIVVLFGNVLGSAGSVVPTFREQIERGGPITITDPRMRRFFMTIPEASRLVLQAAAMGEGGEIFVLDMGEPIRIMDLAKDMIRLSGLPESAIEITYSGIRPGEKLYEELYFSDEESLPTSHTKLRASKHRTHELLKTNEAINLLVASLSDANQVKRLLSKFVPEYSCEPTSTELSRDVSTNTVSVPR